MSAPAVPASGRASALQARQRRARDIRPAIVLKVILDKPLALRR